MKKEEPPIILENAYNKAFKELKKDKGKSFFEELEDNSRENLFILSDKAENAKAIIAALATSLTKKIKNPEQDIRLHKTELKGGYSARGFDTKYVTPFFKKKFRRLAMKESGWLTRSIEQPSPFNLDFPGKIRDPNVKRAFLKILDNTENGKLNPESCLIGLFILLIGKTDYKKFKIKHIEGSDSVTVNLIVNSLKKHFFEKYRGAGASKLPVIAIYSIYEILLKDVSRYKEKHLLPLKSHISSDKKSHDIGDVTIMDGKSFFESVEIKHNIQIGSEIVDDAFEKIKDTKTERYYILTTAEPNIKSGEEKDVEENIRIIRETHGCEIIVNGIVHSLKYYLRLLSKPSQFIERYTQNLEKEFESGTEIKECHIQAWKEIIKEKFS